MKTEKYNFPILEEKEIKNNIDNLQLRRKIILDQIISTEPKLLNLKNELSRIDEQIKDLQIRNLPSQYLNMIERI